MKRFAEMRGKEIKVRFAEGFRQHLHLGHAYPNDNKLKEILGYLVLTNINCQIPASHIL
jgi:hypothetical protein